MCETTHIFFALQVFCDHLRKKYIYIHETRLLSGQINGFSRFVLFTDDLESAFNGRAEREGERRAAKGQKSREGAKASQEISRRRRGPKGGRGREVKGFSSIKC